MKHEGKQNIEDKDFYAHELWTNLATSLERQMVLFCFLEPGFVN